MSNGAQMVTGMAELCALPPVDKWQILDALTAAAEEFELNHRTLSVLRALISFLPQRDIHPERNSTIVFPSNRSLSERLHGMPESTLRRHLARLVDLGIVSRHDSANRKRFSRRGSAMAYGFDLSPLAVHARHICELANTVAAEALHRQNLRDEINSLRRDLLEHGLTVQNELLLNCQRHLRRKLAVATLQELRDQLAQKLETMSQPVTTSPKMSSTDKQNERHIQTEIKSYFDSEENESNEETPHRSPPEPTLIEILESCREYKNYFPEQPRSWSDLNAMVSRLVPMIGIETPVYLQAQRMMGSETAASTILCMLERLHLIRNPGGYLRRLSQRAANGRFSLEPMLHALRKGPELSADNSLKTTRAPAM